MKAKGAILVILCLVILVAGARVLDWSVLRRGKAPASRIKWRRMLPAAFTSSPALGSDGSIYVSTRNGSVYALDASGAVQWTYRPGLGEMPTGLLLDQQDDLYLSTQKRVLSLTASGKKRWETVCTPARAWQEMQAGALGDGVLYAICGENLSALNTADGHQLWSQPLFESEPLPVVLQSGALVSSRTWSLVASDASGDEMWKFPPPNYVPAVTRPGLVTDNPFFSAPIAVDSHDTVYTGSGDGEFSAFGVDGTLRWTYDVGALRGTRFASSPVITADGTVIVFSTHATVYALTPDGSLKWFFDLGDPVKSMFQPSPLLGSDGTIYLLAARGLNALSSAGTKVWDVALSADAEVSPTLAPDGTLYVATSDSALYAVRTSSKGLMNSAWPKYQHDAANSGRASALLGLMP